MEQVMVGWTCSSDAREKNPTQIYGEKTFLKADNWKQQNEIKGEVV
jgi:hypothetical protein